MFPREIVWYIFSFQKMYRYFCISNTFYSLKKIKELLRNFRPAVIGAWFPLFQLQKTKFTIFAGIVPG